MAAFQLAGEAALQSIERSRQVDSVFLPLLPHLALCIYLPRLCGLLHKVSQISATQEIMPSSLNYRGSRRSANARCVELSQRRKSTVDFDCVQVAMVQRSANSLLSRRHATSSRPCSCRCLSPDSHRKHELLDFESVVAKLYAHVLNAGLM